MEKHFVIKVQLDEQTRFLCDDAELCQAMAVIVRTVVGLWTSGPRPAVTVQLGKSTTAASGESGHTSIIVSNG